MEEKVSPVIDASWKEVLEQEFSQPYFLDLKKFLLEERKEGKVIYPPGSLIFNAFNRTPFDKVKVVIIGQDPYHGHGQAHGLSFSVPRGVKPPPSLVNIFKEIQSDLGLPIPYHGNLESWTDQGVLLLNAILTVRASEPASHRNRGWENFTKAAIMALNEKRSGIVFLLWGKFAQEAGALLTPGKHFILTAPHPSPYSANSGFFGCRHFSKANEILTQQGKTPIDWRLPDF